MLTDRKSRTTSFAGSQGFYGKSLDFRYVVEKTLFHNLAISVLLNRD